MQQTTWTALGVCKKAFAPLPARTTTANAQVGHRQKPLTFTILDVNKCFAPSFEYSIAEYRQDLAFAVQDERWPVPSWGHRVPRGHRDQQSGHCDWTCSWSAVRRRRPSRAGARCCSPSSSPSTAHPPSRPPPADDLSNCTLCSDQAQMMHVTASFGDYWIKTWIPSVFTSHGHGLAPASV